MRSRLRPAYEAAELARLYAAPHQHAGFPDHVLRVAETLKLARELISMTGPPATVADLSCGDATIPRAAMQQSAPGSRLMLGDLAPGYEFTGPIEQTIRHITHADLFICTETLEHLDDPDLVLRELAGVAAALVVSTPDDEPRGLNAEHYWSWNRDDFRAMLRKAGWTPVLNRNITWRDPNNWPWSYQIWGCL